MNTFIQQGLIEYFYSARTH